MNNQSKYALLDILVAFLIQVYSAEESFPTLSSDATSISVDYFDLYRQVLEAQTPDKYNKWNYFNTTSSMECKACIDDQNWLYYASPDFQTGQCCFKDCQYIDEDRPGIPFQNNTGQRDVDKLSNNKYLICPSQKEVEEKYCGIVDKTTQAQRYMQPESTGGASFLRIQSKVDPNPLNSALTNLVQCNYEIRYPSIGGYQDQLVVQILQQTNVDIYISVGSLRSGISNTELQKNTIYFSSTSFRNKRIQVSYPYILYISLLQTQSEEAAANVDLNIVYWYKNTVNEDSGQTIEEQEQEEDQGPQIVYEGGEEIVEIVEVDAEIDDQLWIYIGVVALVLLLIILASVKLIFRQISINKRKLLEMQKDPLKNVGVSKQSELQNVVFDLSADQQAKLAQKIFFKMQNNPDQGQAQAVNQILNQMQNDMQPANKPFELDTGSEVNSTSMNKFSNYQGTNKQFDISRSPTDSQMILGIKQKYPKYQRNKVMGIDSTQMSTLNRMEKFSSNIDGMAELEGINRNSQDGLQLPDIPGIKKSKSKHNDQPEPQDLRMWDFEDIEGAMYNEEIDVDDQQQTSHEGQQQRKPRNENNGQHINQQHQDLIDDLENELF